MVDGTGGRGRGGATVVLSGFRAARITLAPKDITKGILVGVGRGFVCHSAHKGDGNALKRRTTI